MNRKKMSFKEWEVYLNIDNMKVIEEHQCQSDIGGGEHGIIYCVFDDRDQNDWLLAHVWIAGEEEVIAEEAEQVGEKISSYCFIVNYCPFCGEKLEAISK